MSHFNFDEDELLKIGDIKEKINVSYSTLYRWKIGSLTDQGRNND